LAVVVTIAIQGGDDGQAAREGGATGKAKGAAKGVIGRIIGDRSMEVEGRIDQAKGAGREMLGDAKDALQDADRGAARATRDADREIKRQS
jgi:uncharacterized protein YjbJ (UPF0337 family)